MAHWASYSVCTGVLFLWVKWPGYEIDNSPPSDKKVWYEWKCMSAFPMCPHDMYKDDFTVLRYTWIILQPVIPLPDKVPLCTGEEDEDVVYCHRAKLFRFTGGEWKERGVGDIKLLKHRSTHKVRWVCAVKNWYFQKNTHTHFDQEIYLNILLWEITSKAVC